MKTLLCAIGRLENRYVREYVSYYKALGFSRICLCDNNRTGEEDFRDAIGDFIDSGFVIIEDWRDKTCCQLDAYGQCLEKYRRQYDWIAFFDCDEFLTLNGPDNIRDYLGSGMFGAFDMIHVNWMTYGDCSKARYSPEGVVARFTEPLPLPLGISPNNLHIKSIIRGGRKRWFTSMQWKECTPHTPKCKNIRCCNASGLVCDPNSPFNEPDFTHAYLRHYTTKTAEEYAVKLRRGFPDQIFSNEKFKELARNFFRINEVTEEKIEIFRQELGLDFSNLLTTKNT